MTQDNREEIDPSEFRFLVRPAGEWKPPETREFVTPDKLEEPLRIMVRNAAADACAVPWPLEDRKRDFLTRTAVEVEDLLIPSLARELATMMNRFAEDVIKANPWRIVFEPNERKVTRVKKHDAKGRILETESFYA